MQTRRALLAACVVAIAGPLCIFSTLAAEIRKSESTKMDEPMAGEMKKKGMKQGDVKKHGEKWDRKMKDMVGNEERAMTQGSAKK